MKPTAFFKQWLSQISGPWMIGQIIIEPGYQVYHQHDSANRSTLTLIGLEDLTTLVKTTLSGEFRPLRSAPNLATGWTLKNLTIEELVEALRILYPNAISHWSDWRQDLIKITPYLETAERQTGMYHCVRLLSETDLSPLVENVCEKSCLKKRLWRGDSIYSANSTEIPLLCAEACNFFVAKAREVVKAKNPK